MWNLKTKTKKSADKNMEENGTDRKSDKIVLEEKKKEIIIIVVLFGPKERQEAQDLFYMLYMLIVLMVWPFLCGRNTHKLMSILFCFLIYKHIA